MSTLALLAPVLLGAATPPLPQLPLSFAVNVTLHSVEVEGYKWYHDEHGRREAKHWTTPSLYHAVMIYHGDEQACEDNCVTIYRWGFGTPCWAVNASNTFAPLWDWLGDPSAATFLARDTTNECDVWQRTKPSELYPKVYQQLACMKSASVTVPVYDTWHEWQTGEEEQTVYRGFAPVDAGAFPEHVFRVPKHCPYVGRS